MQKRRSALHVSLSLVIAIIGLTISMLTFAEEAPRQDGTGSIEIEQKNTFGTTIGTWTLLAPDGERQKSSVAAKSLAGLAAGTYTILVDVPAGMKSSIRLYDQGKQISFADRPQLTFQLAAGNGLHIVIHHVPTRTGTVSIQSDPNGITFHLSGPNNLKLDGQTPASIPDAPEGLYTVLYEPLQDCGTIPPRSGKLIDKGRLSLSVSLKCDLADKIRKRNTTTDDTHVTIKIGNRDVSFRDVPVDAWFAPFVARAAQQNVLMGYNDASGNPTGEFKPSDSVSIAELAAIAHRLSGTDESPYQNVEPENLGARRQWFAPYVASAENRGWIVFNDPKLEMLRPARRAEVIVTFLQVLDVPLRWQKGSVFTDISVRTRFANAIETAAGDGVLQSSDTFRPEDPINRAEIAKLIAKTLEVYRGKTE